MWRFSLLTFLILGACASNPQQAVPRATEDSSATLLEQLQPGNIVVEGDPVETTTMAELMREHETPGVSVAVIRDGKIDWARGFGLADVETGRAVTPETLFQAASISKPVAAAAALSMVQDGLLDLDEDVNVKLKSWKLPTNEFTAEQPVTLRHLLSHTAGTTVRGFPGYARDAKLPSTIEILDGHGNTDPVRVDTIPGSKWRYSGGGYTILGQLMEDVAGKPYPEILRERVLDPAGMTHSTYVQPLPLSRESDAATAYGRDGSAIEGRYHNYPEIGAAGLWTTAADLARFALAIQQSRTGKPGSLLSPDLIREMLTPGMNGSGLGPALSEDGKRFGHTGANAGFRTLLSASLDDGWGIVVLTNGDGGWALCRQVAMAAAKAYGWSGFQPIRRKRVDIGDASLARIAGIYEILPECAHVRARYALFPNMGTIELRATNGRLIADVPEGAGTEGRVEFLPQSELQVLERVTGRVMDFTVEAGQVTGFKFRDFEARRLEDIDRYFAESSGISSKKGPPVITRNVLQDSKGGFWLATWNGAIRYDGTTFTNVTNKEGLRRYRVFCLLEDDQGNIWFGTTGAGVYRYDGKTYTNYTTKDGLVHDTVLSMLQDRDGNLWFGGSGLSKYDGTTFTSFTEKDGFTRSDVHSISQAPDGSLWFGTRGALFHYDGEAFVNFTEKHGIDVERNSYTPALVDRRGHVWFGGSKGIHHYDGSRVRHVFQPPSFSLMEDSLGHIWFSGGAIEGPAPEEGYSVLNRFDPESGLENILTARKPIEVKAGAIFGLTEDRDGGVWFGTGNGVGRIDGETVRFYR